MNWAVLRDWIDNPIFIKHVRSRLRRQPLAAGVVVVVVLCMCIVWAGYENDAFLNGRAFEWLVVLQGIILIIMGASQISAAVGGATAVGHPRLSPRLAADAGRADARLFLRRTDPGVCPLRLHAAVRGAIHGVRRSHRPRFHPANDFPGGDRLGFSRPGAA